MIRILIPRGSLLSNFDRNLISSFETTMYTPENLKLENEGPKPQEDFGTEPNKRFLEDVYVLIIVYIKIYLEIKILVPRKSRKRFEKID